MIAALFPIIGEVIKRVLPNKDKQVEAQSKLNSMMLDGSFKEFEKQADIIIAEAKSEHKLTAQWRPITMLVFVIIIANNYLVYPYLSLFWIEAPLLELPPDLWQLLKIGLGGYVVGRSGEKIAQVFKK
jgi:hypothetical protein|tara:strand:+ start:2948 stop:3331 length:384 start_codon:yes stop_codon:yes gene_type:complete